MSHGIDIGRKLDLNEYALLASRGFTFAFRYSDGSEGSSAKAASPQEMAFARRHGITLLLVHELAGSAPLTYNAGLASGRRARGDGLGIGYPLGWPIPDADATDTDINPLAPGFLDYCNGYYDGLDGAYLAGIYGSHRVVKHVRENFPGFGFFWQTLAWSGGLVYPANDCYQHVNGFALVPGLVVDLNTAYGEIPWRLR